MPGSRVPDPPSDASAVGESTGRGVVERFPVGGWVDAPAAVVASRLVLLGEPDGPALRYVGFVRLGPREEMASRLGRGLEGVEVDECPFVHPPEVAGAHWCRSGLAVSVRFDGRNAIGRLRVPSLEVATPTPRIGSLGADARRADPRATTE